MATFKDFIARNGITMTAEYAASNPNMDDDNMDHWRCQFHFGRKVMTTYFSMGVGHKGAEPKAHDVLSCLVLDASGVDATSFDEWCRDYGYSDDSRKAERIYKACKRTDAKLRQFLREEFEPLFDCSED